MKVYIFVALGGFSGAISRFFCSQLFDQEGTLLPIETLIINLIGCFLLSYLIHLPAFQRKWPQDVRTGITTGFIGSFTTFSTLSVESLQLLQQNQGEWMVSYIIISLIGGYIFVHLGYRMASIPAKRRSERERQS